MFSDLLALSGDGVTDGLFTLAHGRPVEVELVLTNHEPDPEGRRVVVTAIDAHPAISGVSNHSHIHRPGHHHGVATLGVTGERDELADTAAALSQRVRAETDLPLILGVGISTPDQVAEAGALADGVIVGSAIVRTVMEADSPEAAAKALHGQVEELGAALRR